MPITINGSGTVTGISAGGLPDDCIVTADIADNNVTTAKIDNISVTEIKIADGAVSRAKRSEDLTLETAKASTSGTSIDFTGIPSWVKRVTVMFDEVSLNGSNFLVQIGAGSLVTSGYPSRSSIASASTNTVQGVSSTAGFIIANQDNAGSLIGQMNLLNISGNSWIATHFGNMANWSVVGGSRLALSGSLDRVRITTVSGTNTFDAGSVNIMYE
jgi:hypothetical protein